MKIKKGLIVIVMMLSCALTVKAQDIVKDLEKRSPNEGVVVLNQDPRIALLLKNSMVASGTGERIIKHSGYRIQIFAGNNSRVAKKEAARYAYLVRKKYPEIKTYARFLPPRWVCRAGDFLSIEEADAVMREMKKTGAFKEISVVRDEVNISY